MKKGWEGEDRNARTEKRKEMTNNGIRCSEQRGDWGQTVQQSDSMRARNLGARIQYGSSGKAGECMETNLGMGRRNGPKRHQAAPDRARLSRQDHGMCSRQLQVFLCSKYSTYCESAI